MLRLHKSLCQEEACMIIYAFPSGESTFLDVTPQAHDFPEASTHRSDVARLKCKY